MRIISQDGLQDVPYTQSCFYISAGKNRLGDLSYRICRGEDIDASILGYYSTEEKAKEVMHQMRRQYSEFISKTDSRMPLLLYFLMPEDNSAVD